MSLQTQTAYITKQAVTIFFRVDNINPSFAYFAKEYIAKNWTDYVKLTFTKEVVPNSQQIEINPGSIDIEVDEKGFYAIADLKIAWKGLVLASDESEALRKSREEWSSYVLDELVGDCSSADYEVFKAEFVSVSSW